MCVGLDLRQRGKRRDEDCRGRLTSQQCKHAGLRQDVKSLAQLCYHSTIRRKATFLVAIDVVSRFLKRSHVHTSHANPSRIGRAAHRRLPPYLQFLPTQSGSNLPPRSSRQLHTRRLMMTSPDPTSITICSQEPKPTGAGLARSIFRAERMQRDILGRADNPHWTEPKGVDLGQQYYVAGIIGSL